MAQWGLFDQGEVFGGQLAAAAGLHFVGELLRDLCLFGQNLAPAFLAGGLHPQHRQAWLVTSGGPVGCGRWEQEIRPHA